MRRLLAACRSVLDPGAHIGTHHLAAVRRRPMNERALRTLLILLGLAQLGIDCWMTFATSSFGKRVAPFGHVDSHDLRDFATYYLALGIALLVAATRPAWRFPILALATLEYSLHTINHAIDIHDANPEWVGPADLAAVAGTTLIFAWLAWRTAPRAQR